MTEPRLGGRSLPGFLRKPCCTPDCGTWNENSSTVLPSPFNRRDFQHDVPHAQIRDACQIPAHQTFCTHQTSSLHKFLRFDTVALVTGKRGWKSFLGSSPPWGFA